MTREHIPEEIIEEIRNRFDIVDIISRYIELKKKGRTYFGLCPFHSEKTPSFAVSTDKQIYHCFGCGAGGNVYSFLMNIDGINFVESIKKLADEAGIELLIQEENNKDVFFRNRLFEAHELSAKYYHYILTETEMGKDAYTYLVNRGFTKEAMIEYQLGYAPDSFNTLLKFLRKRGFQDAELRSAGLITINDNNKTFDRFRNRVMFPIWDSQGRTIAFGGRIIGSGEPKYLNSSDTPIYNKSKNLYNLHKSRSHSRTVGEVLIFEGYVDVITAYQKGIYNTIATLGTSLTVEQARLIRRNVERAYLLYDGDDAGKQAAIRASQVLEAENLDVKIIVLPDKMDPDDYLQKNPANVFRDLLKDAISRVQLQIRLVRNKYSFDIGEEKVQYAMEILELISEINQAPKRDYLVQQLSKEVNLSLDSLKDELEKRRLMQKKAIIVKNQKQKWNKHINNGKHSHNQNISIIPAYQKAEREILWVMMNDVEQGKKLAEKIRGTFQLPEHSLLAARIYTYYQNESAPSLSKLLNDFHEQPEVIRILSSMQFQFDEYDASLTSQIESSMQTMEKSKLEAELKKIQTELEIATKTGKQDRIVELLIKIQEIQKNIKLLRK